jgi:hypothetical protein
MLWRHLILEPVVHRVGCVNLSTRGPGGYTAVRRSTWLKDRQSIVCRLGMQSPPVQAWLLTNRLLPGHHSASTPVGCGW